MTQEKQIGPILGMINRVDAFKLLQCIFSIGNFLALVFILIFTGMFGHIISDELQLQRIQVLRAIEHQDQIFKETIESLHPHFLIESPMYSFRIGSDGALYIDGKKISSQEELNEFMNNRRKTLRSLEGNYQRYYDHLHDRDKK